MEEDKYDYEDLVVSAIDQKPIDFENIFSDLIVDKIANLVSSKKQELAQNIFKNNFSQNTEEE